MASLSKLGEKLAVCARDPAELAVLERIRRTTQSFAEAEHVDIIHLAENLIDSFDNDGVKKAAGRLKIAAENCIIKNRAMGREVANANGLSVWFPVTMFSHAVNRSKYLNLKGTTAHNGWIAFLDEYFANNRNS